MIIYIVFVVYPFASVAGDFDHTLVMFDHFDSTLIIPEIEANKINWQMPIKWAIFSQVQ